MVVGLYLRITDRGSKSWLFRFTLAKRGGLASRQVKKSIVYRVRLLVISLAVIVQ